MTSNPAIAANTRPWRDPDAKPFISIQHVTKRFGDFTAVNDVSLDIFRGELFCLLGGSGCGKSTLLRMLAGFETPTEGKILIDGVDLAGTPPDRRPTNMMFQSYALFPHMSVEKNVAYGLLREGKSKAEAMSHAAEMLKLVKLEKFARRKPHQLSGGQRQRVALARALAKQPKVLLLDEPLGALDKKLREETQFELIRIQETLGVTFIVVTHDQDEAMTLATRIGVMTEGVIEQVGEPREIYETPKSRFVADFIGSVNLFEGRVGPAAPDLMRVETEDLGPVVAPPVAGLTQGQTIWLAMRPERAWLTRERPAESVNCVPGVVQDMGYVGHMSSYMVKLANGRLVRVTQANEGRRDNPISWDEQVHVSFEPADFRVLTE
ncbi:ABC transporter ATP-binding protein [Pararhodobacter aggregans]|uniref:Spermidine/putrescine import ATP-binding protein PotA n=1 Tax=Pararhodobacter aggregans TaxID=404875 RepID=A0A2T7UPC5_9RHOB|nr:ABC transporter ATP-binding protein [Pararhodobacter aggregans]PTX01197.1 putrescine transport system ATP-binding protein [Pararhodobacter aggregans]PVE46580.1 polyamine ABC transporter ATP-binding protein [Pararhodobacter aggregans]